MKRLTALILGCLFLISALTACAGGNKTDDTTAPTAVTTQTPDETTSNLDAKGYLKDSLPEISFGDTEFSVLYWSDREHEEFVSTEQTGEAINDAIYARNAAVETRAGVKLNFVGEPGNASNVAGFTNKVKAVIDGGERDLDMIGTYSLSAGNLAVKGFLSDLRSMEYLDWEKPWWPDQGKALLRLGRHLRQRHLHDVRDLLQQADGHRQISSRPLLARSVERMDHRQDVRDVRGHL